MKIKFEEDLAYQLEAINSIQIFSLGKTVTKLYLRLKENLEL